MDGLGLLEKVQTTFLRRLLGLTSRSCLAPLFTETGLWPLRYRRLDLALRYLRYGHGLPTSHLLHCALRSSQQLLHHNQACWLGDLIRLVHALPVPVTLDPALLSVDYVDDTLKRLVKSVRMDLANQVASTRKLVLLQSRLERDGDGKLVDRVLAFRDYLRVSVPSHRKSLTRFLLSSHGLAVERLRWDERYRPRTPRDQRLCRFCREDVEDEVHVLLVCARSAALVQLRTEFLLTMHASAPATPTQC